MERSAKYFLLCFALRYLLSLLFNSDGGIIVVRNVSRLLLDYTTLHLRA